MTFDSRLLPCVSLPRLRLLCINGVGSVQPCDLRALERPDDFLPWRLTNNVCATCSVTGSSSLAHFGLVSANSRVSGGIDRQIPSRVSNSSGFLKLWLLSRSSTNASSLGRTGSIKSHGKESRDVDYADCLIEWDEPRSRLPQFVAPLTQRGRQLALMISNEEDRLVAAAERVTSDGLRVAQEGLYEMVMDTDLRRVPRVTSFQVHVTRPLPKTDGA